MTLEIRANGVDYEAGPIWAADTIAFERRYDQPGETIFSEQGVRTEWLLWVGWHALERAGKSPPSYEELAENLESIVPHFSGRALFTLAEHRRPIDVVDLTFETKGGVQRLVILPTGDVLALKPGEEIPEDVDEGKVVAPNRAQRRGSSRASSASSGSRGATSKPLVSTS